MVGFREPLLFVLLGKYLFQQIGIAQTDVAADAFFLFFNQTEHPNQRFAGHVVVQFRVGFVLQMGACCRKSQRLSSIPGHLLCRGRSG